MEKAIFRLALVEGPRLGRLLSWIIPVNQDNYESLKKKAPKVWIRRMLHAGFKDEERGYEPRNVSGFPKLLHLTHNGEELNSANNLNEQGI
jgi:hypothetical protein